MQNEDYSKTGRYLWVRKRLQDEYYFNGLFEKKCFQKENRKGQRALDYLEHIFVLHFHGCHSINQLYLAVSLTGLEFQISEVSRLQSQSQCPFQQVLLLSSASRVTNAGRLLDDSPRAGPAAIFKGPNIGGIFKYTLGIKSITRPMNRVKMFTVKYNPGLLQDG